MERMTVLKERYARSRLDQIPSRFLEAIDDGLLLREVLHPLTPRNLNDYCRIFSQRLWLFEAEQIRSWLMFEFEDQFTIIQEQDYVGIRFLNGLPSSMLDPSSALGAQLVVDILGPDGQYYIFEVVCTSEAAASGLIQLSWPTRELARHDIQRLRGMKIRRAYLLPPYQLLDECHEALNFDNLNQGHVLGQVLGSILSGNSNPILHNFVFLEPLIYHQRVRHPELEAPLNRLDEEQRKAVTDIMSANFRPYPYVIGGVPGSGKTETLIEAVHQVYRRSNRSKRILVCARSRSYLKRLYERVVGVGGMNVVLLEDQQNQEYLLVEGQIHFATTLRSASLPDHYFDYIFLDKAPATHQPETLVVWWKLKPDGCFVMSGDRNQLYTQIEKKFLGDVSATSMQELFSYSPRTDSLRIDPRYITYLRRSYRCDPAVLGWSDRNFYGGQIMPGGNTTPGDLLQQLGLGGPVVLVDVRHPDGSSLADRTDHLVVACSEYLARLNESNVNDVAIIAMTTQVNLRDALRRHIDTNQYMVDTDDQFLGIQRKAVIIVLDPLRLTDQRRHQYIYGGRRRLTLAMSRAEWIVVIIGDFSLLRQGNESDAHWQDLMGTSSSITFCPNRRVIL